ncbi:MAG: hypothetical protein Ta2A_07190 [Treponemataceae bacterium]|nr:MAG: hypothetical protein Ta2A_07190 [Treponemataceae bacterium]
MHPFGTNQSLWRFVSVIFFTYGLGFAPLKSYSFLILFSPVFFGFIFCCFSGSYDPDRVLFYHSDHETPFLLPEMRFYAFVYFPDF